MMDDIRVGDVFPSSRWAWQPCFDYFTVVDVDGFVLFWSDFLFIHHASINDEALLIRK